MNDGDAENLENKIPDVQKPKRGRRPLNHPEKTVTNTDTCQDENTDIQKDNISETSVKRRKVSIRIVPRKDESEDRIVKTKQTKIKIPKHKAEEPKKVITRKERILHFLNKDQFQILYPEIRPFKNKKHAIECLLPYHLFGNYEDENVLEHESGIDTDNLLDRIRNAFVNASSRDSIVVDILKLEEAKYKLARMKTEKDLRRKSAGKVRFKIFNKGSIKIRLKIDGEMLKNMI